MRYYWVLLFGFLVFFGGCASSARKPLVSPYRAPVLQKPIEEREVLPTGDDVTVGILAEEQAPFDGLLLSERAAVRYRLIRAERDTLREVLEIERQAAVQRHDLMTNALADMHKQAQRTWFERHAGVLGLYGGFLLGSVTCIVLVYGISSL